MYKILKQCRRQCNVNVRYQFSTTPEITYEGPNYDDILRGRQTYLSSNTNLFHAFRTPMVIQAGRMQWLYDHTGKKYLDMYGSIATCSVGHCNPKVNDAVKKQLDTIWHTTAIYMTPILHEYVEKLLTKLPKHLQTIMFTSSGSEANDLAMLLARQYTKNFEIISLRNAFHGITQHVMGLTSLSKNKFIHPGLTTNIHHALNPDPYAGAWGGKYCRDSLVQTDRECNCDQANGCQATLNYFNQFEEIFKYSIAPNGCAAMFFEPIQGFGGVVQYTKGYIKMATELVRKNGGLIISDEVQAGIGRTGEHFWAYESHGIEPDIITIAKGIGNGFPMGIVATTKKVADVLTRASYFSTFGGHALGCAASLAVLNVIDEENLQANVYTLGNYMIEQLKGLRNKYDIVGDVRGKGFMLGVELVEDKLTRKPLDMEIVNDIMEDCRSNGVLFGKGGLRNNVIRLKPPLSHQ